MAAQPPPSSDPQADLTLWLDDFAPSDQARGRAYHAEGRVRALNIAHDALHITVTTAVRGTSAYACHVSYEPDDGWAGDCSCPVGYECKHLYASGLALQLRLAESLPPSAPASAGKRRRSAEPPIDHEAHLITQFTTVTGGPPDEKQRKFLGHLAAFHRSLFLGSYLGDPALHQLIPNRYRYSFITYYENPLANRWSQPPATPLELWSHLALAFTEKDIPLPPFMARLTDLAAARRAVAAHRLERELALWRNRFNALEADAAAPFAAEAPPLVLGALRLRLTEPKTTWEISPSGSAQPDFRSISATALRDLLYAGEQAALTLEPASAAFVTILQAHLKSTSRTTLKLSDATDRTFLARLLIHPLARDCLVGPEGAPIVLASRRLGWHFTDHPTDPDLCLAQLAFPDGTLAPTPLLHLTARPALYLNLAGPTLFTGFAPSRNPIPMDASSCPAPPSPSRRPAATPPAPGLPCPRKRVPASAANRFLPGSKPPLRPAAPSQAPPKCCA